MKNLGLSSIERSNLLLAVGGAQRGGGTQAGRDGGRVTRRGNNERRPPEVPQRPPGLTPIQKKKQDPSP